ncbi:M10 family metallopeptidase [Mesorhizobium sp. IMUNJ 23232]|uniref:M10 family metallopeptidase n=1 Tax=Mesorhizobium sp. IMUNJ 23232 TaxID=3376064 RepID=UPI00379AB72B
MTTTNVTTAEARAGLVDPSNAKWAGDITYSIPGAGAVWQAGYGKGEPVNPQYGTLDATQATDFGTAMALWDSYIAPSITEVSDANPGNVRIAFTDVSGLQGGNFTGYGYGPPVGPEVPVHGDIWIDETLKGTSFACGTSNFELLLHEAGHALGLKHPFEAPTLPAGYDSTTYTVMSYTHQDYFYTWSGGGGSIFVSYDSTADFTPMVLDIAAIQAHYGADKTTATGNTTYAFTDTSMNGRQAIYDAGGIDTIDLSALSRGSKVDLRPGAYSDVAYYSVADQTADLIEQFGAQFASFITNAMNNPSAPAYEWESNVGLTFTTVIENVAGSKFADELTGNAAANVISDGGKGAADTMMGLGGNDIYRVYNSGDVIVEASTQGAADRVMAAVDYVLGAKACIELLTTNGSTGTSSIDLTGNTLEQTIIGNAGANVLNDGGKGAADTMQGLGGNDTYRIYNAGDVIIEGAGQGNADRVASAVDYRLNAGVGIEIMTTNGSTGTSNIDLAGNAFAQQITGNAGNNRLEGREGNDTLSGLGGADTFVFNTKLGASNVDTVVDFNVTDDRFLLSDAIFAALSTGVLLSGYFRNNTTGLAQDSNDHIIYERDTGELYYDANGSGSGGGILFAKIGMGLALTNADFEVV